ncbi:unnamed protein product [Caenorhabditis bovis]|uniref:Uncharacterized protein n=1 Tax=Caenorhabditis bovis TaxID=2654633 RepID=A0A8S1FE99_9PELO|nr:unnamed protein product [Caenorhabditis bovis]
MTQNGTDCYFLTKECCNEEVIKLLDERYDNWRTGDILSSIVSYTASLSGKCNTNTAILKGGKCAPLNLIYHVITESGKSCVYLSRDCCTDASILYLNAKFGGFFGWLNKNRKQQAAIEADLKQQNLCRTKIASEALLL